MGAKSDFLILQYIYQNSKEPRTYCTTPPYYPNGLSEGYFNSKFLKLNYQKNKEKIKTEILSKTKSLIKSGYINQCRNGFYYLTEKGIEQLKKYEDYYRRSWIEKIIFLVKENHELIKTLLSFIAFIFTLLKGIPYILDLIFKYCR